MQTIKSMANQVLLPVIAILADHLEVPSSTLCLTAFMWPECDFLSTPKTCLSSNNITPFYFASYNQFTNNMNNFCWNQHAMLYFPVINETVILCLPAI